MSEILERLPPLLHEVAPHVPPALSQIVARALAKDPAARFSRAADMRAALEPFVGRPSLQPSMVVGSLSPPSHGQPPSPASTAQGTTAGSGVASTLGMVPPTVDYAPPTGPHVAQAYGVPPPTLGPGPYAPPPSRRAALPFFLLGGLVAALLAGVVVVAFVLVHDRGAAAATENVSPSAAPAAKATGATSAIVAAAGTPTAIDAGTAGRRAHRPRSQHWRGARWRICAGRRQPNLATLRMRDHERPAHLHDAEGAELRVSIPRRRALP